MKNTYRDIAIYSVVALTMVMAIIGPRLRENNPLVDPLIKTELLAEGQMSWEAPLLEMVTWPVARIDSFDVKTEEAVIGMYSWFGLRVGRAYLHGCRYGQAGNINENFGCFGGGKADYIL